MKKGGGKKEKKSRQKRGKYFNITLGFNPKSSRLGWGGLDLYVKNILQANLFLSKLK